VKSGQRAILDRLAHALGRRPQHVEPLDGAGHGAVLWRITLDDAEMVAKTADARLASEGRGLVLLAKAGLPTPAVHHADDTLLVMDYVDNDGSALSESGAQAAAEMLAKLHAVTDTSCGFDHDCMLGGLTQLNERMPTWLEFFRHKRLVHAAWLARRSGRIDDALFERIERLADNLDGKIDEPKRPALLHGDLWSGNVLTRAGEVVAFIDPAPYFGHPEIELAFTTLFGGFPQAFYDRYFALRPSPPGFEAQRRDIYLLYPLLVHAALFGGTYGASVARLLDRIEG
jgi:fructosamine-3-kinase